MHGGVTSTHLSRMCIDLSYGNVSPARYPNPGRKRKSAKSAHPAGKKKKEPVIQHMTLMDPSPEEDCDPVVREVVEDTRAAVEEMMKKLNDMVEQSTQTYMTRPTPGPKPKTSVPPVRWTIWCAHAMTCVWRHENLKRDGSM